MPSEGGFGRVERRPVGYQLSDTVDCTLLERQNNGGPPRLAEVAYAWERPEPRVVPAAGLALLGPGPQEECG